MVFITKLFISCNELLPQHPIQSAIQIQRLWIPLTKWKVYISSFVSIIISHYPMNQKQRNRMHFSRRAVLLAIRNETFVKIVQINKIARKSTHPSRSNLVITLFAFREAITDEIINRKKKKKHTAGVCVPNIFISKLHM